MFLKPSVWKVLILVIKTHNSLKMHGNLLPQTTLLYGSVSQGPTIRNLLWGSS